MAKHGKKYLDAAKLVDQEKRYLPEEAVALAKKTAYVKFDPPVEVHLRMGADPKHADQQVRGVALLPNGLGKKVRVMAFVQGEGVRPAQDAGADYIGDDDTIKKIEGGWADFEVSVATPDMMTKVAKLGRILGRRGLMPNPRAGTVVAVQDIPRAIQEAKKGRLEFRLDRSGLIHTVIGRAGFEQQQLLENLAVLMQAIAAAKPTGIKGNYIRSAAMNAAMGPAIKLDLPSVMAMKGR